MINFFTKTDFISKKELDAFRLKYPAIWKIFDDYSKKQKNVTVKSIHASVLFDEFERLSEVHEDISYDIKLTHFRNVLMVPTYNFYFRNKLNYSSMSAIDTLEKFFEIFEYSNKNTSNKLPKKDKPKITINDLPEILQKTKVDIYKDYLVDTIEKEYPKAYSILCRASKTKNLPFYDMDVLYTFSEHFDITIKKELDTWCLYDMSTGDQIFMVKGKMDTVPRILINTLFKNIEKKIHTFLKTESILS